MPQPSVSLVRFDTALAQPEIGKPRRPISGETVFKTMSGYDSPGGEVTSGIWESSAGTFRSDTTGYIEFGYILEGAARVVDPDGTVHELNVGDPFVMPEGYKGHWEVDSRVKKVYVISIVQTGAGKG